MKNSIIILFVFVSFMAKAQEKKVTFYPTAGITWRSTVMNYFNFGGVQYDPRYQYPGEKNVQGFSLNLGMQALINDKIGFEYYSNFRYDAVGFKVSETDTIRIPPGHVFIYEKLEAVNDFIIDHNFNIFLKKRKTLYGLGLSIVNTSKRVEYREPDVGIFSRSLEFQTFNAFVSFPIKKVVQFEIKALYIPKGSYPENLTGKYVMYSLRAYYKFNFLNTKRKKKE